MRCLELQMGRIVLVNCRNRTVALSRRRERPSLHRSRIEGLGQPNQAHSSLSLEEDNLPIKRAEHDMAKKAAKSMANPVRLKPVDKSDGMIQVIIETPKGSRNKFAYDVEQNILRLHLPSTSEASTRTRERARSL